ncbi:deoxycytidine triphosphate deaminase [Novosphingobium sp. 1949]|uniref:Deoxycytidine triphosphate deaminase n=1 Tax=Novosphingobium organovorum TaxID=2930092 RepID=A0ABT0BF81_9SPHN|nr:deoxycytidine triphosphate deaminase [Novosphingobium organovorum]MCJ2183701.1 deoxycytidine triphosphate deaminase [Novosphingobium organovorum]
MFWGAQKLKSKLEPLISGFSESRVDGAAYRLRVGSEVYVSPTGEADDPRNKPKTVLGPNQTSFTIASGQFGFILTDETIEVPEGNLAFISIRAKYKFAGLVNVSGFHVDPCFKGKLIFSVFNAGPNPVHLDYLEECFLIWFADLDGAACPGESKKGYDSIPFELMTGLAKGTQSFASLESTIRDNDKKVSDRVTSLEREQAVLKWALAAAMSVAIGFGVKQCTIDRPPDHAAQAVAGSASGHP